MKLLTVRDINYRTCDTVVQYQLITENQLDSRKRLTEALKNTKAKVTYYDDADQVTREITAADVEEILNAAVDVSDEEVETLKKLVGEVIREDLVEGILDMLNDSLSE